MSTGRNFGQRLPEHLAMQQVLQALYQTDKYNCIQPIEHLKRLTEEKTKWMGPNFDVSSMIRPATQQTPPRAPIPPFPDYSKREFLNLEHSNSPSQSPCSSASVSLISREGSVLSVENPGLETWSNLLGASFKTQVSQICLSQNQQKQREGVRVDSSGSKVKKAEKKPRKPYTRKNVGPVAAKQNVQIYQPEQSKQPEHPVYTESIAPKDESKDVSDPWIMLLQKSIISQLNCTIPMPSLFDEFNDQQLTVKEFWITFESCKQWFTDVGTKFRSDAHRKKIYNILMFCKWNDKSAEEFLRLLLAAKYNLTDYSFWEPEPEPSFTTGMETNSEKSEEKTKVPEKEKTPEESQEIENHHLQCIVDMMTSLCMVQVGSPTKIPALDCFGRPIFFPIIKSRSGPSQNFPTIPLEAQDISACFDNIPSPSVSEPPPEPASEKGQKSTTPGAEEKFWDAVHKSLETRPESIKEYVELKERFAADIYDPVSVHRFFALHEELKRPLPHFPYAHTLDFVDSPMEATLIRYFEKLAEEKWLNALAEMGPLKFTKVEKHIRENAAFQPTAHVTLKSIHDFYNTLM